MQITRNGSPTAVGRSEWFTGTVYVDPVAAPAGPSRLSAASVHFEPGEDHWHGAAPDHLMTHLALQQVDDQGSAVTWGAHVTDEEYAAAPAQQHTEV
ncbi:MAG TPA: hypothetical protein VHS99_23355 [Chloroflexota bacterium]|nr:hypothetical protein [Chloroflexota bacterium]